MRGGCGRRLAKAALVGDLSSVLPEVIADLRSNSVVDAAVESTVTDAIETLFGDTGLWGCVAVGGGQPGRQCVG